MKENKGQARYFHEVKHGRPSWIVLARSEDVLGMSSKIEPCWTQVLHRGNVLLILF